MSLKLTVPNHANSKPGVKIYYVSSESNPSQPVHIVVQRDRHYFCDCRDFMIRHLPNLTALSTELCKHGEFCQDAESKVPAGHRLYSATREIVKSRRPATTR